MKQPKLAVISSFLGKTKDRFHEYNEQKDLEQKFQMVNKIDGMTGVEIVYPYEVYDAKATKALLDKYGLEIAAVNANVKAEPEFRNGGLTSGTKSVRDKAVRFIKESKDFAAAIGADKVTCCPLGDGYEFSFQVDYATMWKRLVDTIGEAGAYRPDIPLYVEYKPSETRGRVFVDTASKALCLLNDIGNRDMGITLDFGHSMYGQENPAEAVALLAESPYRYYIHINDNDARWDWDYFTGTKHFLEYVEFIYYLRKYGYTDYLTSDTSPTRWNVIGTFAANNRMTRKIWALLDQLDRQGFPDMVGQEDYLQTWKFIEDQVFRLPAIEEPCADAEPAREKNLPGIP